MVLLSGRPPAGTRSDPLRIMTITVSVRSSGALVETTPSNSHPSPGLSSVVVPYSSVGSIMKCCESADFPFISSK